MTYNIAWEMFMLEEQDALKKMIDMGSYENLAQGVIEMTPQKEVELQKLANMLRPIGQDFESAAKKQWLTERMEQGLDPDPQSPEEEAALQKMLDNEQRALQEQFAGKVAVQTEEVAAAIAPLEAVVESPKPLARRLGRPPKVKEITQ